jgi:integrase
MQKWCVKRKLLPTNVLVEIYAQEDFQLDDEEKEARVLLDEEIRYLWLAMERSGMALKNKLFLQLCLFFGCRNGELRRAKKTGPNRNRAACGTPQCCNRQWCAHVRRESLP